MLSPAAPEPLVDIIEQRAFAREAPIPCPLCGQWRPGRILQARFDMIASVAECEDCRLAYQSPRPSDEASQAYMNMRWSSGDSYVADAGRKRRQAVRKARLVRGVAPHARALLDFGAGSGAFVAAARQAGFEAEGVERSESARARAKAFYDVDLLETPPEGGLHEVVTLWDVIEHLRDPVGLLAWLRGRMAPGGLIVLETGNYENWKRLARGDRWGLYLLDHHFYFTPASLEAVTAAAGFGDFRLLDRGHRQVEPPGPSSTRRDRRDHAAYLEAMRRWPGHGDINVMIATARA